MTVDPAYISLPNRASDLGRDVPENATPADVEHNETADLHN